MRKIYKYLGLPLVYLGVILLVTCFIVGWTNSNILLISGVFLIAIGIITYVIKTKKESEY